MSEVNQQQNYWKHCSSCKTEIPFGSYYQRCSVSTCNSGRSALYFCSVPCWDAHLGFANHRDSAAIQSKAPTREEVARQVAQEASKVEMKKEKVMSEPVVNQPSISTEDLDTLVVVSKVKNLIKSQSQLNTSQCAIDALTKIVMQSCVKAIENAKASGRKTVMGRDF